MDRSKELLHDSSYANLELQTDQPLSDNINDCHRLIEGLRKLLAEKDKAILSHLVTKQEMDKKVAYVDDNLVSPNVKD